MSPSPQQLRLRLSHPNKSDINGQITPPSSSGYHHHHRQQQQQQQQQQQVHNINDTTSLNNNNTMPPPSSSPSSSYNNLQSQSLHQHQALHPPPTTMPNIPSSKPSFKPPLFKRIISKRLMPKIKLRHSTLIVLGGTILFAFGSVHRLHYLALHADDSTMQGGNGHHRNQWDNDAPHHHHQLRTTKRSITSTRSRLEVGRYPQVIHISHLPQTVWDNFFNVVPFLRRRRRRIRIDDPMLHHDGWIPSYRDYTKNNKNNNEGEKEGEEEEESQCVPMAQWQTTSYPNCNSIHEIELVRSSTNGSYALPSHTLPPLPSHNIPQRQHQQRRRTITAHPPTLHTHHTTLLTQYPSPLRKKNAKLQAQGIWKEEEVSYLGQGWFRGAWKVKVEGVPEYDEDEETWGVDESVVLKTLRIERDFLEEYYELHRRDALSMERLTFSPYVLNIYGYCGQSAINELANFGIEGMSSLEKVARSFRGMDHIEPVSKIKLQLASMVAAGVSHMHSVDYPDFPEEEDEDGNDDDDDDDDDDDEEHGSSEKDYVGRIPSPPKKKKKKNVVEKIRVVSSNATLVHYDLNPRNIAIVKRGKPKLNDFNVAEFLTWDTRSNNKTCGFAGRFKEPWWRAPEEMQRFHPNNNQGAASGAVSVTPRLTEKVDIYSLGNILWDILTTHSPRGKMNKELEAGVRPLVARGELPSWPSDFNRTKLLVDPALMAIEKAMMKCLRVKPEDRPTAGEVAYELSEAIDNLPEGFGDKEKWKERMRVQGEVDEKEKKKKKKTDGGGTATGTKEKTKKEKVKKDDSD